jgi:hypothetical protein
MKDLKTSIRGEKISQLFIQFSADTRNFGKLAARPERGGLNELWDYGMINEQPAMKYLTTYRTGKILSFLSLVFRCGR